LTTQARCLESEGGIADDHPLREHVIGVLGIGAVIIIGLSFLPRRRPVVTISVNPSLL
jgi:hypothetical protein